MDWVHPEIEQLQAERNSSFSNQQCDCQNWPYNQLLLWFIEVFVKQLIVLFLTSIFSVFTWLIRKVQPSNQVPTYMPPVIIQQPCYHHHRRHSRHHNSRSSSHSRQKSNQ